LIFIFIIVIGYVSGVLHKLFFQFDYVIYLYVLNAVIVSIDIVLYYRNQKLEIKSSK